MRETSSERTEGEQGLPLSGRRLDGPGGAVQPLDEMPAEREPGADLLTQHFRWHPEHPADGGTPAGRQVDAVLIPGTEPPSPPARDIHPAQHGVLRTDMAQQVDSTVDEHPPEVRVAGLDANLGTALGQFRELIIGEAVEQADIAKLVGAHHIVTWLLMRSASGWPRRLPRAEAGGTDTDVSHRLYPRGP